MSTQKQELYWYGIYADGFNGYIYRLQVEASCSRSTQCPEEKVIKS